MNTGRGDIYGTVFDSDNFNILAIRGIIAISDVCRRYKAINYHNYSFLFDFTTALLPSFAALGNYFVYDGG